MNDSMQPKHYSTTTSPIFGTVLPVLSEFSTEKSFSENYLLKDESHFEGKIPHTKIIATIGPSTSDEKSLRALIDSGMNIARINLSHGSYEDHKKSIATIRSIESSTRKICAIMVDTRGKAYRTAGVESPLTIAKNSSIALSPIVTGSEKCRDGQLFLNDSAIFTLLKDGDDIIIGYGMIKLRVMSHTASSADCTVITGGQLFSEKTIFLPNSKRPKSSSLLSEQEIKDIHFAISQGADFLAASYVSCKEEVTAYKKELNRSGGKNVHLIAKIECEESMTNFEEILRDASGILISRGNLGEEIPLESVTLASKLILRKCNSAGKIAIIATQMLESMIINPFPTRAEASDVGNAVFDGTDCVMLSGETAIGKYPIKSLRMMVRICLEVERSVNYTETFNAIHSLTKREYSCFSSDEAIASSAVKIAMDIQAAALIAICETGTTGRLLSKYRPKCPILMLTDSEHVARHALASRNVLPLLVNSLSHDPSLVDKAISSAKVLHLCKMGDAVVVVRSSSVCDERDRSVGLEQSNMINVRRIQWD